ncbi:MAG: DUF2807 domain-containing protein [Saprospiraceae bacterium]
MLTNILRFSLFIALLSLVACGDDDVVGSGPNVTQSLDIAAFDQLAIDGSFNVNITQGDSLSVIATGQANVIDVINTSVAGQQWSLAYTVNNVNSNALLIDIVVPTLSRIESDGSADVTLGAFTDQTSFLIDMDGSGSYTVTAPWTDLESLNLSIDGSGEIDGFPFNAVDVNVDIDGSGEVDVTASEKLDIRIDGSGSVRYRGNPTITQTISGSGQVLDAN